MTSNPAFRFDHVHIIAEEPHKTAHWYVEKLGAEITADDTVRGAPQIAVALGGMNLLVRGRRDGEEPRDPDNFRDYGDFSSHNRWGADHIGFAYEGDLAAYCVELEGKGVQLLRAAQDEPDRPEALLHRGARTASASS